MMKGILIGIIVIAALIIAVSGCRKNVILGRDLVTVQLYKCSESLPGVSICFDSLITDSCCPEGATCIWAGTAVIKVTFRENGNQHQFNLAPSKYAHPYLRSDTVINHYKVEFIDLYPKPPLEGNNDSELIRATFKISKE